MKTLAEIQKKLDGIEVAEGDYVTQDLVDMVVALTGHIARLQEGLASAHDRITSIEYQRTGGAGLP